MQRNPTRVGGAGQSGKVYVNDRRNVVVVGSYTMQGNYCCPSCDHSALMQSVDQAVDFVCVNCDEQIRERGGADA